MQKKNAQNTFSLLKAISFIREFYSVYIWAVSNLRQFLAIECAHIRARLDLCVPLYIVLA